MKVVAYGDTNVGKIRENNEDNFLILDIENGKTGNITEPNPGRVYLVVADGMGGAAAGEKASAIVIEASMKSALELKDKSPQEVNVFSLVKAQ
ncbi:MAG: hypothetical protein KDK36_12365, partial [Leptospiraceae bacterium]|nr:hypothetical protein [Leptospiraceae bacterium]